jgi:hypothetical protein
VAVPSFCECYISTALLLLTFASLETEGAMMTEQELEKREKALTMAMERMLPDFVKSCRETAGPLLIHQDAFAVDYDEYELLGMAIKFAGLYGKEVRIVGKNRGTLSAAATN